MWRKLVLAIAVCFVCIAAFHPAATAHVTLTSYVALDFDRDRLAAELQLPLDQLELALVTKFDDDLLRRRDGELRAYVLAHFAVTAPDGRTYAAEVRDLSLNRVDDAPYVRVQLFLHAPPHAGAERLIVHDDIILHRVVTHRILISVRRDFDQALFGSEPKLAGIAMLSQKDVIIDRSAGSAWRGLRAAFVLGVHHIAEGTDHLLFVVVLLLVAPLTAAGARWQGTRTLRDTLRAVCLIITSFTVGHSLALAFGAAGWLVVASSPVEVLIAASIVVTALHALRPFFAGREPVIGFAFGLIHGLAFATALKDFGFHGAALGLSLLGFNLGIEAMQLAVVILVVPSLVYASRTRAYPPLRIFGATLAMLAACAWIAERVSGHDNAVTQAVAGLAAHGQFAAWVLALASFAATLALRASHRRARNEHAHARPLVQPRRDFDAPAMHSDDVLDQR